MVEKPVMGPYKLDEPIPNTALAKILRSKNEGFPVPGGPPTDPAATSDTCFGSMTIDTACSGSLVALDVACRYLRTREMDGAIVAGCNLYLR